MSARLWMPVLQHTTCCCCLCRVIRKTKGQRLGDQRHDVMTCSVAAMSLSVQEFYRARTPPRTGLLCTPTLAAESHTVGGVDFGRHSQLPMSGVMWLLVRLLPRFPPSRVLQRIHISSITRSPTLQPMRSSPTWAVRTRSSHRLLPMAIVGIDSSQVHVRPGT